MQNDESDPRASECGPRRYEVLWTPENAEAASISAADERISVRAPALGPRPGHGWWTTLFVAALAAGLTVALGLLLEGEAVRAEETPELARLRADVQLAARELAAARRSAGEAELRAADAERELLAAAHAAREDLERVQGELDAARQREGGLAADLEAARARAEELAARPQVAGRESTDEERASRAFLAGLAALDEARVADAREACAALERLGLGGGADLARVADCADSLARFEASCATDRALSGELRAALQRLDAARGKQATLADERWPWLALPGVAARVAESLARTLDAFAARCELARAKLFELDAADWASAASGWKATQSSAVLDHAENFGCAHLSELAPRLVPELRTALLQLRQLDLAGLREVRDLPVWAERVRTGVITLSPRERTDLELLAFAQRWFDDTPGNERPPDWASIEFEAPTGEHGDWRRELALLWSLSQPDSGFPVRDNGLRIYRQVDAQGRVEFWRELALSARDGVWRVQRERLADDGSTPIESETLRIERRGGEFVLASSGETLLDLRALGATTRVAEFEPHFGGALPSALGIAEADLAAFRAHAPVCLIHHSSLARRLFEPRWGLVRETLSTPRGLVERELVFAR
ncbi:MAG: hypothetical protein FJ298_04110 [Planctomycetes bacterium]|nr:hypothetical protein [Planctomycetota bacterium]